MITRPILDHDLLKRLLVLAGIVFVGAGSVWWWTSANSLDQEKVLPDQKEHRKAALSPNTHMDLHEADFAKMVEGRPVYRIKVDRFKLENKKIGFFSIGGLRQIEMEGVRLDLYRQGLAAFRSNRMHQSSEHSILQSICRDMGVDEQNLHGISGFEGRRVEFHLWDRKKEIYRLRAKRMTYAPRIKSLVFRSDVHVVLHGRQYHVDEAVLQLDQLTLRLGKGQRFDMRRMGVNSRMSGEQQHRHFSP